MPRTVFCSRLKKELPGLEVPPFPGERGVEIFETVSLETWTNWQQLQTMLINERHLDLSEKENRKWLSEQMMLFLENKDYKKPDGFIPLED